MVKKLLFILVFHFLSSLLPYSTENAVQKMKKPLGEDFIFCAVEI